MLLPARLWENEMKSSFKAAFFIATLFCFGLEEFAVEQAQAGVLVRQPRSRLFQFRRRGKRSTYIAKKDKQPGRRGRDYGVKKTIGKVYASRLKEYKVAIKNWQKEKKLAIKLEKQYAKMKQRQDAKDAKTRMEMARRLAKQREKQQIAIAQSQEEEAAQAAETGEGDKKTSKSKSFFSKLSGKTDTAKSTYVKGKTGFKKDKLKFMSRLFLSLFGKE